VKAFGPGNDLTSLQFAAKDISAFMLEVELIEKEVDLAGLFDSTFITRYAQDN
jgi:NitT/TauT family transport system substrate-binding protein